MSSFYKTHHKYVRVRTVLSVMIKGMRMEDDGLGVGLILRLPLRSIQMIRQRSSNNTTQASLQSMPSKDNNDLRLDCYTIQ